MESQVYNILHCSVIVYPFSTDDVYVSVHPPEQTSIAINYNQQTIISFVYVSPSAPELLQNGALIEAELMITQNNYLYSYLLNGSTFEEGSYVLRSSTQRK